MSLTVSTAKDGPSRSASQASIENRGSPAIAAALLRAHDRLALFELHPNDYAPLQSLFADDRRVNVRKAVVSVAEIRPRVRSRASLKRAEDIEKAMGVLEAKGGVQRMPEGSGGIGGRPSARYALHPALRNDDRLIAVF